MKKVSHFKIQILFEIIISLFFLIGIICVPSSREFLYMLFVDSGRKGYFLPLVILYFISVLIFVYLLYFLSNKLKERVGIVLFTLSLIVRLLSLLSKLFVPMDDFKNYYEYGVNFYFGNYEDIAQVIAGYQMPKMGGIAVFNGILARIFSTTLLGSQIANCFITSCIVLLIYLLVKRINSDVAIIAGVIYAIYPSNIIQVQCTTNFHGATLFALLGLFLAIVLLERKLTPLKEIIGFVIVGFIFSTSDVVHPSAIIWIIALLCWMFFVTLQNNRNVKKLLFSYFTRVIPLLVSYFVFSKLYIILFYSIGIISSKESVTILYKLAVGLNYDTSGMIAGSTIYSDVKKIPYEEQGAYCIEIIKQELSNFQSLISLFGKKIATLWYEGDTGIGWTYKAKMQEYQMLLEEGSISQSVFDEFNQWISAVLRLDKFFVTICYFILSIGLIFKNIWHRVENNIMLFCFEWLLLGWIGVYLLIEVQPRYRYSGMIPVIILTAYGLYYIYTTIREHFVQRK